MFVLFYRNLTIKQMIQRIQIRNISLFFEPECNGDVVVSSFVRVMDTDAHSGFGETGFGKPFSSLCLMRG